MIAAKTFSFERVIIVDRKFKRFYPFNSCKFKINVLSLHSLLKEGI